MLTDLLNQQHYESHDFDQKNVNVSCIINDVTLFKVDKIASCLCAHDQVLCSSSSAGKNHVCKFIGCGRNDKFNYVVMQLQVSRRAN